MVLRWNPLVVSFIAAVSAASTAHAQNAEDLAKQLSNPIASLISVPFQFNYNRGIGPARDGEQAYVNFQPVIPVSLGKDWNLISRTILPIIDQHDVVPQAGTQFGLGDTTQSFFFSPKKPLPGNIIWGVGPALLIPTGTDELLSSEKWGAGPTAVVLTQQGGWTIGVLANHIWSYAGAEDRAGVNSTFLQPFVSYTTKDAWTFTLNSESTYNWTAREWSVPLNLLITKLVTIDKQPISLGAGVRYWADTPEDSGPEGWGARAVVTFLFPTGK
jgi:hypothetical protein